MYKKIIAASLVAITSLNLFAEEPSAFGAGNLDNPSPYGLTSSEKTVLQNKTKLKKIVVKSNNQANEVDSLRERIDGLQSIIESLSRKAQSNKRSLSKLEDKNSDDLKNSDEYGKRLGEIAEENSRTITNNALLLEKLTNVVDIINKTYVNKNEFNVLVDDVNKFKSLVAKELKNTPSKAKKNDLDSMSNADVSKKAKAFYDKQYYTKGIEYYSHLILKNYKPANAHYMIGQMNFKRKNYSEAISYYKKSASLYSEASYMAELMLNTAISMDKTNDKKNAKAFYNGVVSKFPQSSQAKSAKKYLKSL
ncbi:MAG: tetratricopeptide repeat protein [Sulfurimonas sp.]|nr:tetratricopeptide repeat protein [Sulfurimonas sp.]MDQ7062495.1 tetratricopeptide repeat protein [Sulfurimonas sp.]